MVTTVLKTRTRTAVKKTKNKMSLWDYVMKFKKKPLFTIAEEDRDLVLGSNMMTRLLQY